jgi:triphosphoribosyl-dephospho-CoA synthetase
MRLNLLLDAHLRSSKQEEEAISSTILVFKLVKEKNLFENLYRRLLLNRLVHMFADYRLEEELRIVDLMEKECGDEWTKRIRSICQLFLKNRDTFQREKYA